MSSPTTRGCSPANSLPPRVRRTDGSPIATLQRRGGLDDGLPGLGDQRRDLDGRYGLRHVVKHLVEAGREQDVHRVLALEGQGNAWFSAMDGVDDLAGYSADVATAWRAAETTASEEVAHGRSVASIALELRYALLSASMTSIAAGVPPARCGSQGKGDLDGQPRARIRPAYPGSRKPDRRAHAHRRTPSMGQAV